MHRPSNLFISYASSDEHFKRELEKHLTMLEKNNRIRVWDRSHGVLGQSYHDQIQEKIHNADFVLLLVSPDFMSEDIINEIELPAALKLQSKGQLKVIPIILRPCLFDDLPFQEFQLLPKGAKPVTEWTNRDKAFLDVTLSLKGAIENKEKISKGQQSPNINGYYRKPTSATTAGEYHKISCNRTEIMHYFWRNFQWKEEFSHRSQHFFLIGKEYGEAPSLIRRIHYELLQYRSGVRDVNQDDFEPLFLRTRNSSHPKFVKVDLKRIFMRSLGLKEDVHSLQDLLINLENYHAKLLPYQYVPITIELKLEASCWDRCVKESVKWFIEEFSALDQSVSRTFLFFVIFNFKATKKKSIWFWPNRQRNNLPDTFRNTLNKFAAGYPSATLLPELTLVQDEDLDDWIYTYYEKNERLRQRMLLELKKELQGAGPWNMSDIEIILRQFVLKNQIKLNRR